MLIPRASKSLCIVLTASFCFGAKEKDKKPEWNVEHPPIEFDSVRIKTDQITWPDVDVSPDGKTLVFNMLGDLYTVPLDGGKAKPLTEGLAWDMNPAFSPDGKSVVFVSDRDGGDNIWTLDLAKRSTKQISHDKENFSHNPSYCPGGQFIVAQRAITPPFQRSIPGGEIWLYHVEGGEGSQIRELMSGRATQKTIGEPACSPDGRYVYYSVDVSQGKVWSYFRDSSAELFQIRRWDLQNGEEETIVSGPGGAVRPIPSPDGTKLAFAKRVDNHDALFVKDLKSGEEELLVPGLDRDLQESEGALGNMPRFSFTPDSRTIVFWSKGYIQKVDLESKKAVVIPIQIDTTRSIAKAKRFPVEVSPQTFEVKMPRWVQRTADGKSLIFQALGYIHIKDLKTGSIRRLTQQTESFEYYPALSRDGRKLVYTTANDQKLGAIIVHDLSSGTARTLSVEPGLYLEPRFDPKGQAIVYRKISDGYFFPNKWSMDPGIYYQSLDGKPKRIARNGQKPQFGALDDRVYVMSKLEENGYELFSVDTEGRDKRVHYSGTDITDFTISPDGRWLAFTEQYNIFLAPLIQTGKPIALQRDSKMLGIHQISRKAGNYLSWSADSQELFWSHGTHAYRLPLKDALADTPDPKDAKAQVVEPKVDELNFVVKTDKPNGIFALTGGRVVTMRDADKQQEVIEQGVVLVEGQRIVAVGNRNAVKIPAGARIIDVTGKTIIPGLIDVHAHGSQGVDDLIPQQNWRNFSSLAFGVTTIHDPSNNTTEIFSAAELQRAGLVIGPRIYSTGTILYGAFSAGATAKVESYEDALFHVQRLKDSGAVTVKSYMQPLRSQKQMLIAAAQKLGIMVVPEGGMNFQSNMAMIADGHIGIEHAISLATAYEDVLQFWSASKTGYTPTLGVAYGGIMGENYWYDRSKVWENERLLRYVPAFAVEPASKRRQAAPDNHYNHFAVAKFARTLRDRGVSVQLGAHGQREGLAAHWELWMLEQGGFTPWQALRAGTVDGARYLAMEKDIGSLEVGKLADLVVIDGDPLKDLRRSEYVAYTMVNGRLYDAKTMNEIGNGDHKRQAFFFENHTTTGMHATAQEALLEKSHLLHWMH